MSAFLDGLRFLGILSLLSFEHFAVADQMSQRDAMFAKLAAPMNSIVDGKPFRDAVDAVAQKVQLNIWIDRNIDPSAPVFAGPVGPTVFMSIEMIARQRGCVVMPVEGVLLIGRANWVDQTAATLLSLPKSNSTPMNISWPTATLPMEAIARAIGEDATVTPKLPHDLWPAIDWKGIKREVALTLILAQFSRQANFDVRASSITTTPMNPPDRMTRKYDLEKSSADLRGIVEKLDRKAKVRAIDGRLQITTTIAVHRQGVAGVFASRAKQLAPASDSTTYSLKPMTTTGENAFRQFASVAGKRCQIEKQALAACQTMITIEAKDLTVKQLVEMVAEKVGVTVAWQSDTILVQPQP